MHRIEQAAEAAQEYADAGMSPADAVDCVRARFGLSDRERSHTIDRVEGAIADALVGAPIDSHVSRAYAGVPR